MQSIDNKVVARIYGRGRGWAFSRVDFAADFGAENIRKALSRLALQGRIRRVLQGIYDYPKTGKVLDTPLAPDLDQVAQALARKFGWRIQPTGAVALNLLGLSTQVPGRWIYASDGPARSYQVGNRELLFQKAPLREAGFKLRESELLVQGIKALGREGITETHVAQMRKALGGKDCGRIRRETKAVPEWIHRVIKLVCEEMNG